MMSKFLQFFKVIVLSVLTFGIYGAYWIFVNMMGRSEDPDAGDRENAARDAQNTVTVAWMHFLNK